MSELTKVMHQNVAQSGSEETAGKKDDFIVASTVNTMVRGVLEPKPSLVS